MQLLEASLLLMAADRCDGLKVVVRSYRGNAAMLEIKPSAASESKSFVI